VSLSGAETGPGTPVTRYTNRCHKRNKITHFTFNMNNLRRNVVQIKEGICHLDENCSVLYGYETWSLPLREEHKLRVSENRVLSRTFRHGKEKITAVWRKFHDEKIYPFCSP
jgi:hypothetical protein